MRKMLGCGQFVTSDSNKTERKNSIKLHTATRLILIATPRFDFFRGKCVALCMFCWRLQEVVFAFACRVYGIWRQNKWTQQMI